MNEHVKSNIFNDDNNKQVNNIDEILKKETTQNNKQTWRKLDNTTKVNKLTEYSKKLGKEKKMDEEEISNLSKYLISALERKRLISVKDVIYDNKTGAINKIPCLIFSQSQSKNYTLKRVEKRTSTLKSLNLGKTKKNSEKIEVVNN
tara:strand:+ start:566 stop:1006 length:441 start_codon:yes stop_codon:yes gene_type:complete